MKGVNEETGKMLSKEELLFNSRQLHKQSEMGSPSRVLQIINQGADVNWKDYWGRSALSYASNFDVASLLVEYGADLNAQDKDGNNPLMCALYHRHDVAELLIENGADLNVKDNSQTNALMKSACRSYLEDIATLLIERGADIHAQDSYGKYALMGASARITAMLIRTGSEVNARDNAGRTALMYAPDVETAAILIQEGADVNAKDEKGKNALMCAHSASIASLLLANGADVNARDDLGRTALMHACNHAIALLLIEYGADINIKDNNGESALLRVLDNRTFDQSVALTLLLDAGAEINAQDNKGVSLLMKYAYSDDQRNCSALVLHGADPSLADVQGRTAFDMLGQKFDEMNVHLNAHWNQPRNEFHNHRWTLNRAPMTPEEKQAAVDVIVAARAKYLAALLEFKRQAAWNRRKALLDVVTSHGLRPLAARAAAEAVLQPEIDPSAPIPPIPRGTAEENMAYLVGQVFTHETIFKSIVSYI